MVNIRTKIFLDIHVPHDWFEYQYIDDTWESKSAVLGKFWNVVLEKDGEDQSGGSCEK